MLRQDSKTNRSASGAVDRKLEMNASRVQNSHEPRPRPALRNEMPIAGAGSTPQLSDQHASSAQYLKATVKHVALSHWAMQL